MGFEPVTLTTSNVKESLRDCAKKFKVSPDSLTFDILGSATYYKKHPSPKWIQLDEKSKKQILQTKYLTSDAIHFKEQYKIKVYTKQARVKACAPEFKIQANSTKSKAILIVSKTSIFSLTNACLQEFTQEIRRKLVLSNYLIGIFSQDPKLILQPLIAEIKAKKRLTNPMKLALTKALEPGTNFSMKLIHHYLEKDEDKRTAYEKGVDPDELIMEYVYPISANSGRSCQGTLLAPFGPEINSCELITYDETIRCSIEEESMKFYANKSGYVDFENNHLVISNSLNLESAAFNTTGSITIGGHREIDLKITSNDEFEDAIDKGVDIDVSNLDVRGSVGGNTSLKAETIKIGAQTHKTTQIVAEDASVNLHRGDLKAKNAEIAKLEHGLVQGETVKVREMLGGEIRAKHVTVDIVHSKVRIYASESITIGQIKGVNNKFVIAPDKVEDQDEAISKLEKEIETLKKNLVEDEKEFEEKFKNYEVTYSRIDEFKLQVAKAMQSGMPPPKAASIRVKQYTLDTIKLKEINGELSQQRRAIEDAIFSLDKYKNIMLYATINFKGTWDGHQEIFYEYSHPETIEKYIPEGRIEKIIYTHIEEENLIKCIFQ
jgi:hypothetical protein